MTAAHGRTLDGALLHGTFTGIHSSVSRLGASDHISDQVLIGMMSLLEKTEQSNSPAWSADTNPQSCSSAFGLGTRSGIQAATRTLLELLSYDEPRPKLQVLGRKATTLSSGQCFAECCRQHWKKKHLRSRPVPTSIHMAKLQMTLAPYRRSVAHFAPSSESIIHVLPTPESCSI